MANEAWQITTPGVLSLKDLGPIPKPGPKQALVRIQAASLNYRDKLVVNHDASYRIIAKPDLIPVSDAAGIVQEAGADSVWKKGDRVVAHPNTWRYGEDNRDYSFEKTMGGGQIDGVLRRWMLLSDESVFKAPNELSMEEASTLYTAGVTAFRSLFYGGVKLGPGSTVLTQGTGGVSCYAIMCAAATGATVVATSSSDEKLEVARKLGATHLVNYRKSPDWASEVLKVTYGKGVDLVVDVVGAESMEKTLKCTSFGGTVCVDGVLSSDPFKPVNIVAEIMYGAKTSKQMRGCLHVEILTTHSTRSAWSWQSADGD